MANEMFILVEKLDEIARRIRQLENDENPETYLETVVWNVPLIGDGVVSSISIFVEGVLVGNPVSASHDGLGTGNWLISGHVESTDNVRVVVMNKTGGILGANGNVTVYVWQ